MKTLILFLCITLACQLSAQGVKERLMPVSPENINKTEGYYNWGASIIKGKDGKYHNFYARWEKKYSFYGWLTHSEVAHAVSDSPAGPWKVVGTALKGRGKGHWDAITAHNPKIKFFEGKYYLYYISTHLNDTLYSEQDLIETSKVGYSHPNWKILRPNQRVGVAVSESLNGPWKRFDKTILEPSGPITTLTVNPAIVRGPDKMYYLIVKGDKPNETRFIRNQAMAVGESPLGPFKILDQPVIDYIDTEDMSMWYDYNRRKFYSVFHTNHEGAFIGIVESRDGKKWEKSPEYKLMKKYVVMNNGDTIRPNRLERPYVYFENGEPQVLSLAAKEGDDSYTIFIPIKKRISPSGFHNHRQQLGNSFNKFTEEKTGTVAFLGGSITYNGGWRDSVMVYLKNRFPETKFTFIAAGISSMGTTPAAFRLDRDVLSKGKVDLLFEEAAVNDDTNGRSALEQQRAMEGIVRSTLKSNPKADIVLMHFVDPGKIEEYNKGLVPEVIQNHEMVAMHYNVPTINLAKEVTERINEGEFTWENDFINLHPSPYGQSIYGRSIIKFLKDEWSGNVQPNISREVVEPLNSANYEEGFLFEVNKEMAGKWEYNPKWKNTDGKGTRQNYVNAPMLIGTPESGVLKFEFEGSLIGIAVAAGPDAGVIQYKIDNGDWKKLDLYTKWSGGLHLPWYYTLEPLLDEGKHKVRVRVLEEKNEKSTGNVCRIRYFYSKK